MTAPPSTTPPSEATAPPQPPSHPPLQLPQSSANVLAHVTTTANAGRIRNTNLRITDTSGKEQENQWDRAGFFSSRPELAVGRRDPSLLTTEQLGRLISWIDYVDLTGFQGCRSVFSHSSSGTTCPPRQTGVKTLFFGRFALCGESVPPP
jgi:hypothetical protein